jgi:hypothetical protein
MIAKQISLAKDMASRGLLIFPQKNDKKGGFVSGYKDTATSDTAQLDVWAKEHPRANFGALCGKSSGIVVVDVDVKNPKIDGAASYHALCDKYGEPETVKVRSPSGGWHLYFQYPQKGTIPTVPTLIGYPGVEILSDGHDVTLPGSFFGPGGDYTIVHDGDFAPCPDWLIQLAREAKKPKKKPRSERTDIFSHDKNGKIVEGQRHAAALDMVAKKWNSGAFDTEAEMLLYAQAWWDRNCDGDPEPNEIEDMVSGWIDKNPDPTDDKKKQSQADKLVALALDAVDTFWATSDDHEYATIPTDGHRENLRLRSRAFKNYLANLFYIAEEKSVGPTPMETAIITLCGRAVFGKESEKHESHVRVAQCGESIYFDLGRPDWKVVKIDPGEWVITDDCPIKFVRPAGLLELEIPDPKGDLAELRAFINTKDEDTWVLVAAWLINSIRPVYSQPILVVTGEQGSAKTTLCRVLRSIVDPNFAEMRSAPRELHDLAIAAHNGWIITIDNLAGMPNWLSDGFCRLSTGGGMSTRRLYTGDEEELFQAIRPTILNGIGAIVSRPDLMDRSVLITLPAIKEDQRIPESTFYEQVNEARPRILGGLFTCVATAMDNIGAVELVDVPRMADFSIFATAAADAMGWKHYTFVDAYFENRKHAHEIILENSPLAAAIMKLSLPIEGSPTDIMHTISEDVTTKNYAKQKGFPKSMKGFSTELDRLTPNFREVGIFVTRTRSGKRGRIITIEGKGSE